MEYHLSFTRRVERIIEVSLKGVGRDYPIQFQLPIWRPGKYTRQHYAANLADVTATSLDDRPLEVRRLNANLWEVYAAPGEAFELNWIYYANVADAGGSYIDEDSIYVNPINLLLYIVGEEDQACELQLDLPKDFEMACGLPFDGKCLHADSLHTLLDAPFFAGKELLHHQFLLDEIPINLWFQEGCNPDMVRMEEDFRKFSSTQIALFGGFPQQEYHYLFVIRGDLFRHGVEHYNSTTLSIGPGPLIMAPRMYQAILELCSHEFFHTWNVKALRPVDLFPYDYSQEQYSALHYITEGVTTYYGDKILFQAGVYDVQRWLECFNGEIQRHFRQGGRLHVSLEEASLSSWVNGYAADGIPNRRISFYAKGCLVAFLLDVEIRMATRNQSSLDDVMREMYKRFACKDKPYTGEDYQNLVEEISGRDFKEFFKRFVQGTDDLEPALQAAGAYLGLELNRQGHNSPSVAFWGLDLEYNQLEEVVVRNVYPESPAAQSGLSRGDQILSINQRKVQKNNIDSWLAFFQNESKLEITYFRNKVLRNSVMEKDQAYAFFIPQFTVAEGMTRKQIENLACFGQIQSTQNKETVGAEKRASFQKKSLVKGNQ